MTDISRDKLLGGLDRAIIIHSLNPNENELQVVAALTAVRNIVTGGSLDADPWIPVSTPPEAIEGNKVIGHNGTYAFECEYEDGLWCNIGGETMTHYMKFTPPK